MDLTEEEDLRGYNKVRRNCARPSIMPKNFMAQGNFPEPFFYCLRR
jgi:hypothetical protein